MKPALTVVGGAEGLTRRSALEAAYEHFRLNLLGNRVSENRVRHYDYMVRPFLAWAAEEGLRRFEDIPVERVRHHRAEVASRTTRAGRQLEGRSVLDAHKALMTFFRWAAEEEYPVDQKMLSLKRPRVPEKEPTVYHVAELRAILAACKGGAPAEELAVRILVGAGVRASELCGLAVVGPDGLPDVMTDSPSRGRVDCGCAGTRAPRPEGAAGADHAQAGGGDQAV